MASNPIAPWPMAPWFNWMTPGRADLPPGGEGARAFKAFSPMLAVNGAGDPALEREIVEDVATYGAQIGQITEVVLALAAGDDVSGLDAFIKLKTLAAAIEKKKAEYGKTALERARKALEDLREHDPSGYALLIATLEAKDKG